jgi:phospholipid/cholesterol/gamma-HCH transport system substrate-binding protein
MEKRVSYILLGSFVLFLATALAAFLFWLAKYGDKNIEYDYYKAYFTESVSGLSVESLVKLRGVEVGRVKRISISKNNSEEVEVLLEIEKNTPIKKDTIAVLDSQGITGLKYIELKGGTNKSPRLKTDKQNPSTITTRKSVISSIFDNSESITKKLEKVLDRTYILLNDKNMQNISTIADKLSSTVSYIDDNKKKFVETLKSISSLRSDIKKTLDKITLEVDRFNTKTAGFYNHTVIFEDKLLPSFRKLGDMSDKAAAASDKTKEFFISLQNKLNSGKFDISDIVENNMDILNETSLSIKDLSVKIESLVESLKESPSDIVYKSRDKTLGPGEEK